MNGADGYYDAGSVLQLTATPATPYQFTGWSGDIVSSSNPLTVAINSATNITANFSASPVTMSFGANIAAQFSVSGTGCPAKRTPRPQV